jgi:translation elongation factor EF-1beta
MFGEYLLFLFLAAVASNILMFESHSMPNEDDLAGDVDVGPKINNAEEAKSDPKIIELAFEPIAFAFQNIQYKVKVNDGSLCIPSHQTIFKLS